MEQKFLELVQYNVTVKSSLYAKYYFELRALFKDNEQEFPLKPLDKKDAEQLEIKSRTYKDTLEEAAKGGKEKLQATWSSLRQKPKEWDC